MAPNLAAVVLACLAVAALAPSAQAGAAAAQAPGLGSRLVTFGHSYVKGRFPDPSVTPWPEQVATRRGLRLSNRAVDGATSPDVARSVNRYAAGPRDTVVIEAAVNDVGRHGIAGLAGYRAALRTMLRHLTRTGRPRQIILVADPPVASFAAFAPSRTGANVVLRRYARTTNGVARAFRVTFVDLGCGWDPQQDLSSVDGLHPSPDGTAFIADAVSAVIDG